MLRIKLSGKKGVDYNATVEDYFSDFAMDGFPIFLGGKGQYDGKEIVSYIDGRAIQRKEYDEGVGPTAETPAPSELKGDFDLHWGMWDKQEDWPNGCFDDTVVYNRALTPDEVKSLFAAMMQ